MSDLIQQALKTTTTEDVQKLMSSIDLMLEAIACKDNEKDSEELKEMQGYIEKLCAYCSEKGFEEAIAVVAVALNYSKLISGEI